MIEDQEIIVEDQDSIDDQDHEVTNSQTQEVGQGLF